MKLRMHSSSFRITGSVATVAVLIGGLVSACGGGEFQGTSDGLKNGPDAGGSGGATGSSTGGQGSGGAGSGSGGGGARSDGGGPEAGGTPSSGGATNGGAGGTPAGGGAGGALGGGGSSDGGASGGGAGGSSAGGASAGGSSSGGDTGTGGGPDTGGVSGCTSPTTYYPDNDGDQFGRSTGTVVACTTPPNGTWALVGGDCDDDNNLVFPGATTYYEAPYSNSGGIHTFDYDCSGIEEGDPSQIGAAPTSCTGALGVCAKGSGYVPTSRTGSGVNPLCGSKTIATCSAAGALGSCVAVRSDISVAYRCR